MKILFNDLIKNAQQNSRWYKSLWWTFLRPFEESTWNFQFDENGICTKKRANLNIYFEKSFGLIKVYIVANFSRLSRSQNFY